MQDGRRAHERSASGATCLSPELAALIRDAEHVEGQEYEDSLCLREETSVSEANASSRYRSSNGGVLEADHGTRASRRIRRDVESEDADDVGSDTEEDANQALVRSATASVQKYSKLTGRTSELMQRAEKLTRSQGATSSKGGVQTPVPVHNPKRRGSAAGASSANGQAHSSRTAESLAGRASAAVALPKTYADVPRIQLPATSAGKKALKSYAALSHHSNSPFVSTVQNPLFSSLWYLLMCLCLIQAGCPSIFCHPKAVNRTGTYLRVNTFHVGAGS